MSGSGYPKECMLTHNSPDLLLAVLHQHELADCPLPSMKSSCRLTIRITAVQTATFGNSNSMTVGVMLDAAWAGKTCPSSAPLSTSTSTGTKQGMHTQGDAAQEIDTAPYLSKPAAELERVLSGNGLMPYQP